MGGAVSAGEDNEELVDNLVEAEYLKTSAVEKALRAVDRGRYYLEGCRDTAYKDLAWKHGNLHLSAPCIYSEVLECLEISAGMCFLNLGSGTGYLSTVVGLLLGGNGINHGVEIHESVVDYAKKRLEEFITSCPAIDLMDFTSPEFIVGNCLQLDPSTSFGCYDRVYCGAAVPEEQQTFVRSLIKVNGVVVMPCGDQLQKVTRTGSTTYDVKSVLPVSFATLIVPAGQDLAKGNSVSLPERKPLKLQDVCRSKIRECLRQVVYEELPEAQLKSLLQQRQGQHQENAEGGSQNGHPSFRRRRRVRRIVIPVLQSDSDDDDDDDGTDRPNQGRRNVRRHIVAIRTTGASRDAGGRIQVEDLRWNRRFVREEEGNEHGEWEQSETEEDDEEQKDMVVEQEVSNVDLPQDSCTAIEKQMEAADFVAEPSVVHMSSDIEDCNEPNSQKDDSNKEEEHITVKREEMEEKCEVIEEMVRKSVVGSAPCSSASRICDEDFEDHSDDSAVYRKRKEKRRVEKEIVLSKQKIFSERMKLKVSQLPLPSKLKDFLNYHRQQ